MIPFPGEAVGILDAADITGGGEDFTLWNDVAYRAGSRTLAAGDEWRTLVYSGFMDYIEETGLDLTVEWVVEVTSGSVTVSAAEGLDPTYSAYSDPLGTSLGSHTLTVGENRITSTFTGDQVADLSGTVDAALILGLAATSGSAVVEQVKMYVHPAGGALGAFVDHDGFDTTEAVPLLRNTGGITRSGEADIPGWEASWDAAASALVGDSVAAPPYSFADGLTIGPASHYYADWFFSANQDENLAGDVFTNMTHNARIVVLRGPDPTSQWPVADDVTGYIRPPTEVADEDHAYLYPQTGTATVQWVNAVATVVQSGEADASVPALSVATEAADGATILSSWPTGFELDVDLIDAGTPLPTPAATATTTTTVALPASGWYLFAHLSHTAADTEPDWPGVTGPTLTSVNSGVYARVHFGSGDPASASFAPVKAFVSMPPYRVWDPTAATVTRGIVRHYPRDDGVRGSSPKRYGGHRGSYQAGRQFGYQ